MAHPRVKQVGLAGLAAAVAAAAWWLVAGRTAGAGLSIPGERGRPVTVEVLNGTSRDGLARRTTRRLRRAGIDVVYFGSASADTFTATLLLVRRGDSTAAARVRDALGDVGVIVVSPDPRLLLDVSVVLGQDAPSSVGLDP